MNSDTNTTDLIILQQHKAQILENRKSNYSGAFIDRNFNWHKKVMRVLAPGNHSDEYKTVDMMQNYYILQFQIIANYLNASLEFKSSVVGGISFYHECYIELQKNTIDMCLNIHFYDSFNLKNLDQVSIQERENTLILVPENTELNLSIFFQPFDHYIWIFMIVELLISVVSWTFLFKIDDSIHCRKGNHHHVLLALIELTIKAGVSKKSHKNIQKWLYGSQILFNFVITTCYSSAIISCMLNPKFDQIDSLKQFRDRNMSLVIPNYMRYKSIFEYQNIKLKVNSSSTCKSSRCKIYYLNNNRNFGFLMRKKEANRYLNSKEYLFGNEPNYHKMKEKQIENPTIFPVSSNLRLTEMLQILMMWIDQFGLRRRWDTMVNMHDELVTQKNLAIKSSEVRQITMKELSVIFWYFFFALLSGFVVFICEHLYFSFNYLNLTFKDLINFF